MRKEAKDMTATLTDPVTVLRRRPARIDFDDVNLHRDGADEDQYRHRGSRPAHDEQPTAGADAAFRQVRALSAGRPVWHHGTPSYLASFVDIVPVLPTVCTITTIFAYIGGTSAATAQSHQGPLLVGGATALVLALVTACLHRSLFTAAEHAHPRSYAEIRQRVDRVAAHLRVLEPEMHGAAPSRRAAFEEAAAHIRVLERDLTRGGPQWIIGTGYVDALTRLHRAEEELIMVLPAEPLLAGALFDELRIAGSTMPDRDRLLEQLRAVIQSLRPATTPTDADGDRMATAPAETLPIPISSVARVSADAEVRIILRDVRHALNDFRDESRARLIRSRSRLLGTMTMTGAITYVLLAFAMSLDPGRPAALNNPITTAAAIYLVGAIVGMFNRLYVESADDAAGEDYGLSKARLLLTPMLSGLAAIGGVMVTGMLTGIVDVSVFSPTNDVSANVVVPTDGTVGPVFFSLQQIFNLREYPFSLLLAAMFGLAPKTFLKRLQRATDQSHLDLQSTTAR